MTLIRKEQSQNGDYNLHVGGFYMNSVEKQDEVYSDDELDGAEWEEDGQNYKHVSTTYNKYPAKAGKVITGFHSGSDIETAFGSFKCKSSNRGTSPALIVFSEEGTGHLFRLDY